jgi:phosphatidate cytidylyltransferase
MSKNLITRIVVAVIFGPLIILICYLGGYWLFGMIALFAVLGAIEFMLAGGIKVSTVEFWLTLIFLTQMIYVAARISFDYAFMTFVVFFIINGIIFSVRNKPPAELFNSQINLVWVVAYLGMMYPFVYRIRTLSDIGGDWLLLLFGTLWLSDTLAMAFGKWFGKSKLAPTVSPNKTIAGFAGGLLGGIIVALILAFWRLSGFYIPYLLGAAVLVSLVGQLGDLVESCWKRAIGVKDSSEIIPGHGGVLDRFDSLLFAAPVLYLYLRFIIYT